MIALHFKLQSGWGSFNMKENKLEVYMNFAKAVYGDKDPAHNFRHIKRICKRLKMFIDATDEQMDLQLMYFMASFHGLIKKIDEDNSFKDEIVTFLKDLGWSDSEIDNGFICLQRHIQNPSTIEEEIVHDANYIELLGAFGIAKAFTTGGAKGQNYEETIRIFENDYLEKIEFKTALGKKISDKRKDYTREFLNILRTEL